MAARIRCARAEGVNPRAGLVVRCRNSGIQPSATRAGPSTFAIFDAFPDEAGRQAHLNGKVAAALMANAAELLAEAPKIEQVDVLADKLPG